MMQQNVLLCAQWKLKKLIVFFSNRDQKIEAEFFLWFTISLIVRWFSEKMMCFGIRAVTITDGKAIWK